MRGVLIDATCGDGLDSKHPIGNWCFTGSQPVFNGLTRCLCGRKWDGMTDRSRRMGFESQAPAPAFRQIGDFSGA